MYRFIIVLNGTIDDGPIEVEVRCATLRGAELYAEQLYKDFKILEVKSGAD